MYFIISIVSKTVVNHSGNPIRIYDPPTDRYPQFQNTDGLWGILKSRFDTIIIKKKKDVFTRMVNPTDSTRAGCGVFVANTQQIYSTIFWQTWRIRLTRNIRSSIIDASENIRFFSNLFFFWVNIFICFTFEFKGKLKNYTNVYLGPEEWHSTRIWILCPVVPDSVPY